jgi:hypothetical protein
MLLNGSQVNINKKLEVNMKETKKKKLSLEKITIWNYDSIPDSDSILDKDKQKAARGGSVSESGVTEIIIFC